jgi:Flp pilus assembly protein TadG
MMKPRVQHVRCVREWLQGDPEDNVTGRASRGQVLVMFALFLTGLISMLGMATDLGYAFSERRGAQNAADAAALAGTRMLVKKQAAMTEATNAADSNEMNAGSNITMSSCTYVHQNADSSITNLGTSCSATPPTTANGVRAAVTETHNTFFMRALPGTSLDTVTISTNATASVQLLKNVPGEGPFLVCGSGLKGGQTDLLVKVGSVWQLNPLADQHVYNIHDSNVWDCDAKSNSYKGVFLRNATSGAVYPGWWSGDTGNQAGPVNQAVNGPRGCNTAATGDFNCVMLLPIAIDNPKAVKVGTTGFEFYVVAMGAFYVTSTASNSHTGTFLYDYSIRGAGTPGSWSPGSSLMPITIRLIQ